MTASHASQPLAYRPEIDGMRAMAVWLVICFHAFALWAPGGFIGVDIFFVISGYLITGLIVRDMEAGEFCVSGFYVRRCRRILPALLSMMAVILLLGRRVLLPDEFRELGQQVLAGAAFNENTLLLSEAGYFDPLSIRKPMLHLWSLGIEEQFYIGWPLLLLCVWRHRMRLSFLIAVLFTGSLAFAIVYSRTNAVAVFYLLPSRFWELLMGAGLAVYERANRRATLQGIAGNIAAVAAVLALAALAFLFGRDMFFPPWALSLGAFVSTVLLLVAGRDTLLNKVVFSSAPAVWMGRISYPLYLWHWPLLSLARITEDRPLAPEIIDGAVALSVVLAWLTWRFIEKPVQKRVRLYPARGVLWASAACTGLVAAWGYASASAWLPSAQLHVAGANDIEPESLKEALDTSWWKDNGQYMDRACAASAWPGGAGPDFCRLTGHPRMAMVGDSHANHLVPGMIALGDPVFSHLVEVSFAGCLALEGIQPVPLARPYAGQTERCARAQQAYYDKIRRDKDIEVVMASVFQFDASRRHDNTDAMGHTFSEIVLKTPGEIRAAREALSRLITSFEQAGKQVVLVIDVPHFDFDPVTCVSVHPLSITSHFLHSPCAIPRARALEEQADSRKAIDELAAEHPAMKRFDPFPYFCDRDLCYAIRDRKLLYRDDNHLSVDGSVFLARAFARWWPSAAP